MREVITYNETYRRTPDADGAESVAVVTGQALTSAVNAVGMRNIFGAEAAARRRRTVGTYPLH